MGSRRGGCWLWTVIGLMLFRYVVDLVWLVWVCLPSCVAGWRLYALVPEPELLSRVDRCDLGRVLSARLL